MLCIGTIYSWSILSVPLAQNFGWTAAQLGVNYTVVMSFFCLGMLAAGRLLNRISAAAIMRIAAALTIAGFAIASRLSGNIVQLYISYGVLSSSGVGLAYTVILQQIGRFSTSDQQIVRTGTMLMAFGASTLLLGSLAAKMLDSGVDWRTVYLLIGLCDCLSILAASFLLASNEVIGSGDRGSAAVMLKDRRFWLFFAVISLSNCIGTSLMGHAKTVMTASGVAAGLATIAVGCMSVANGLSRFFFGKLYASRGKKPTMLIDVAAYIAALLVIAFSAGTGNGLLGAAGFLIAGVGYGGVPTVTAAFVSSEYAKENYAANLSCANLSIMVGSLFSGVVGSLIENGAHRWSFAVPLLVIAAGICVLDGVLLGSRAGRR